MWQYRSSIKCYYFTRFFRSQVCSCLLYTQYRELSLFMHLSSNLFNLCDIEGYFLRISYKFCFEQVHTSNASFSLSTTYPSYFMFFSLSSVFFLNPVGPFCVALDEHDNITEGFPKSPSILHHSSDRIKFLEFLPELFLDFGCLDLVKVLPFKLQCCALVCITVL